jgi:hypothetical protein
MIGKTAGERRRAFDDVEPARIGLGIAGAARTDEIARVAYAGGGEKIAVQT